MFDEEVYAYEISPRLVRQYTFLDRCCTLWNVAAGFTICLLILIVIYLVFPDVFGDFTDPPVDPHDHPDM